MYKNLKTTYEQVENELEKLKGNRRHNINHKEVSLSAKTPFKALWQSESANWRFSELADSSLAELKRENYLGASVLIRACLETVSSLWYLNVKIENSLSDTNIGGIDEILDRMLLGSKNNSETPDSINILTIVDHLEKALPGSKESFESLCELAHPNWLGTSLCFSEPSEDYGAVSFGKYIRLPDIEKICAISLHNTLLIAEISNRKFQSNFDEFIKHCEDGLA